jgi:hypothetical protein
MHYACTQKPTFHGIAEGEKNRKDHLLARAAVVEAARALGLLLLGNGNNGDRDGVELRRVRIDRKGYV